MTKLLSKKIIYGRMLKNSKKTVTFAGLINSKEQTKSGKSEIILNTLSPYDSKVQRYLSLSKEIEQLMNNAKDENEGCVSIELVAEFCVLQEELYQEALKKHKEEAN